MIKPTEEEIDAFLEKFWSAQNRKLPNARMEARNSLIEERRRESAKARLKKLLNEKNVHIEVTGCGCCDSPTLKVIIDGELICDEANFNFDNLPEVQ